MDTPLQYSDSCRSSSAPPYNPLNLQRCLNVLWVWHPMGDNGRFQGNNRSAGSYSFRHLWTNLQPTWWWVDKNFVDKLDMIMSRCTALWPHALTGISARTPAFSQRPSDGQLPGTSRSKASSQYPMHLVGQLLGRYHYGEATRLGKGSLRQLCVGNINFANFPITQT